MRQGLLPSLGAGAACSITGLVQRTSKPTISICKPGAAARSGAEQRRDCRVGTCGQMDPTYAPGVGGLGLRCYYESNYSDRWEGDFQRSNSAYERALALDPNRIVAAGQLITNRVERGRVGKAYQAAQDLVKRRPESAQAHFVIGYVYRYAGMLEKSTPNVIRLWQLDPGNYSIDRARGHSWNWVTLAVPWISFAWTWARNGPPTSCLPCSSEKIRSQRLARRSNICPLRRVIIATCSRPAWG